MRRAAARGAAAKDMNGVDETGWPQDKDQPDPNVPVIPTKKKSRWVSDPRRRCGRSRCRPTCSEISIAPHAVISPYAGGDALHAATASRRESSLGLTYCSAALRQPGDECQGLRLPLRQGRGLDVTVLLQNWIGVKSASVYIQPVPSRSRSRADQVQLRRRKFALGGFDDILNIRLKRSSSPTRRSRTRWPRERQDEHAAAERFAAVRRVWHLPAGGQLAIVGRFGIQTSLGTNGNVNGAAASENGSATFSIRAGLDLSRRRRYFDVASRSASTTSPPRLVRHS